MQRKISFAIIILLFGAIAWSACDKIDDPLVVTDQKEYPENPDDTLFFKDSVNVNWKQVLLEDFTGHRCVNCPEAAELAHAISENNDHRVIIYAVHAGNLSEPVPNSVFDIDLRSPLSNKLNADFGVQAYPAAMINRVEYQGLRTIYNKTNWETICLEQLDQPNAVNLKLINTYFPKLNTVVIDVEAEFLSEIEGTYNLVLYLVEDHIEGAQLNNDPDIGPDTLFNYIHHNVLRAAVNSTYGESVAGNSEIAPAIPYTFTYTYPLNEEWVTENCKIIAYIGKADPDLNLIDIIQVAELGIKTE